MEKLTMLTIFTHCKPFRGHIEVIQRNAIQSWLHLRPHCEILLCGNRKGTAETAKEFGLCHVPDVQMNEYGTPLVNHLFEKAQRLAMHDLLCYVNCDIILMSDFIRAVDTVRRRKKRFLMVGECWNVDILATLNYCHSDWPSEIRSIVNKIGKPRGPSGIDYFVFPRGLYQDLPPFAFGRYYFDNWLIWKARALSVAVVDATQSVISIHQNHDYSHVPGGQREVYGGAESRRNFELAGGERTIYKTFDATHRLKSSGLRRNWQACFRVRSRWEKIRLRWEELKGDPEVIRRWWQLVEFTRPVRHALGLRPVTIARLRAGFTRLLNRIPTR